MFENFSFEPSRGATSADTPPVSSPSTTSDTIEMVSPFSSRCASPFSAVVPSRQYPTFQPRQLSITSLTNKLNAHSLYTPSTPTSATAPTSYYACNSSDEEVEVEDYSEGDSASESLPTPPLSAVESPAGHFDADISSFPPTPTSAPSQSIHTLFSLTRRNRAVLTRLQCSANNAVHLTMLIEEQHPSGLPFPSLESPTSTDISPERRRASFASIGKRKVQKARSRKSSVASLKALESSAAGKTKREVRMRSGTAGSASGAGRR